MSGRQIASMVAGAAVSGAISGALGALGGPLVSSVVTGTVAQFAGRALVAGGTALGSEAVGSVVEGVANAIYTPDPLQVKPPSEGNAFASGVAGVAVQTIDYDGAVTVGELRQSLQGPSGPKPAGWQASRLKQYNSLAAATRFNRKAFLANSIISGLVGGGISAADKYANQFGGTQSPK